MPDFRGELLAIAILLAQNSPIRKEKVTLLGGAIYFLGKIALSNRRTICVAESEDLKCIYHILFRKYGVKRGECCSASGFHLEHGSTGGL